MKLTNDRVGNNFIINFTLLGTFYLRILLSDVLWKNRDLMHNLNYLGQKYFAKFNANNFFPKHIVIFVSKNAKKLNKYFFRSQYKLSYIFKIWII